MAAVTQRAQAFTTVGDRPPEVFQTCWWAPREQADRLRRQDLWLAHALQSVAESDPLGLACHHLIHAADQSGEVPSNEMLAACVGEAVQLLHHLGSVAGMQVRLLQQLEGN